VTRTVTVVVNKDTGETRTIVPSKPPKTAFTGVENIVPLAGIALAALAGGSGLMWLGRKRDDE